MVYFPRLQCSAAGLQCSERVVLRKLLSAIAKQLGTFCTDLVGVVVLMLTEQPFRLTSPGKHPHGAGTAMPLNACFCRLRAHFSCSQGHSTACAAFGFALLQQGQDRRGRISETPISSCDSNPSIICALSPGDVSLAPPCCLSGRDWKS